MPMFPSEETVLTTARILSSDVTQFKTVCRSA